MHRYLRFTSSPSTPRRLLAAVLGFALLATAACSSSADDDNASKKDDTAETPTQGVTADEIAIGTWILKSADAQNQQIGAENAKSADAEQVEKVIVDDINAKGGILGRKVRAVHYVQDGTDQTTPLSLHHQRACSTWTQDDKVFAVLWGGFQTLDGCLADADVPQVCCTLPVHDDMQLRTYPLLLSPGGVSVTRQAKLYVKGLVDAGFFEGPDVKVGLIGFDNPTYARAVTEIDKQLATHSLKLTETQLVKEPESQSDSGAAVAAGQAAMARFKAAGVNRILLLDRGGVVFFFAAQLAEAGAYNPQWGLTSNSAPTIVAANVPKGQMANTFVVGWTPGTDRGFARPDSDNGPAFDKCMKLLESKGIVLATDSMRSDAAEQCEYWWFLRDALEAGGKATVKGLLEGTKELGDSYESVVTYKTSFEDGRRDGAAAYRTAKYGAGCSCFEYLTPQRPID